MSAGSKELPDLDNLTVAPPPNLDILRWARSIISKEMTELALDTGPLPTHMHGTMEATGKALVTNGSVGADLIRLPAGAGFVPHTHPGHHILIVVGGRGTITYNGQIHPTEAGQVYLIEGEIPHAVGAITDHVILAVGAPHKAIDAEDRMEEVPYEEVIAPDGDITCLICNITALAPRLLHSLGCGHCPCVGCSSPTPDHRGQQSNGTGSSSLESGKARG
jgi:quercetin dioxygenase-like cupin family protein